MENSHAPYDSVVVGDENWSEDEEYTQDGSHNGDSVSIQRTSYLEFLLIERQLQVPSYPEAQEDTAPSHKEEDVVETNDERAQDIPSFDLDYSTQYPTATSPDNDDFVDAHHVHQSATGVGAGHSADAPQSNASNSFLSDWQWAQMKTTMVIFMGTLGPIAEKTQAKTATVIIGGWTTDGTKASRPKTFRREGGQSCLEQTSMVPSTHHLPILSHTLVLHFIQVVRSELRRGPPWNICILQTFKYLSNSSNRAIIQQAHRLPSRYYKDLLHRTTQQTPDQATQRVHRDLLG